MKILRAEHADFILKIIYEDTPTENFPELYKAALGRHSPEHFKTSYLCSHELKTANVLQPTDIDINNDMPFERADHPVFFENRKYKFDLQFNKGIIRPALFSRIKSMEKKFPIEVSGYYGNYQTVDFINFENNIGYFDLTIDYIKKTIPHRVVFRFEVFPVKLNFRKNFPEMVQQVETIYPQLVIDYLKKTYSHFAMDGIGENDLVWWTVFGNIYTSILQHLKVILEKPYSSLAPVVKKERVDRIKKIKGSLVHKLAKYTGHPNSYFDVSKMGLMVDNYENRAVKYMIEDMLHSYDRIYKKAKKDSAITRMTDEYKGQLEYAASALKQVLSNPFFKKIGKFEGWKQGSLVLQKMQGYSHLYNDWSQFNKGYRLFDGLYGMELKDIAYLYQIWCFFGIADLLYKITGKVPDIKKIPTLDKHSFRIVPDKKMQSKLVITCDNGTIIELYQELQYTSKFEDTDAGTLKGAVCPDIIMRIGKKDQPNNLFLTYLFDAKYRLKESATFIGIDEPVDEDLRQMEHYKAVILNRQKKGARYKYTKEVMGAYVLFPGQGFPEAYGEYYKRMVLPSHTGGFPFLPGNEYGSALLEKELRRIIHEDAEILLKEILAQKGLEYKIANACVFVGIINAGEEALIHALIDEEGDRFYWREFIRTGDGSVRYFAPYIAGKGICCFYEITGAYWSARRDVYPPHHPLFLDDGRKCMVLELENKEALNDYYQIKGVVKNKRYTQIKHLLHPENGFIKTITEKEVYQRDGRRKA